MSFGFTFDIIPKMAELTRRQSLILAAGAAAAAPGQLGAQTAPSAAANAAFPLAVFSKHLQWLPIGEAAQVAKQIGFDGIDLTVRPNGHVLPERVETELPAAYEAVRAAGLQMPIITTAIQNLGTPFAQKVLETASQLKIRHYRWGGIRYDLNAPLPAQVTALKPAFQELANINSKLNLTGVYHTHSGPREMGAAQWDLWMLLKDISPRQLAFNYDIGHATIEGGLGGWQHSMRLAMPHMGGVAVKDFLWKKTDKGFRAEWCPIGEGMVQLRAFFDFLKKNSFRGPVQVHFEYPLGGADHGDRQLTIPRQAVLEAMQRDLRTIRAQM